MTIPSLPPKPIFSRRLAFTLVELLTVVGIVGVLAAISMVVYNKVQANAMKVDSLAKMRSIGAAFVTYTNDHDGQLPREDVSGKDDWRAASEPDAENAWYNVLPRIAGDRGVADYGDNPRSFYRDDNVLYLRAANYPGDDSKYREPLFAYAMNSRLQRKDNEGRKEAGRMVEVVQPSKTVVFLESGIDGESPAVEGISDYDGSPKGNPRDFVTRYGKTGILIFFDGHSEMVRARAIMNDAGNIPVPQTPYIWTLDPNEDPN